MGRSERTCPSCGQTISTTARRCFKCGAASEPSASDAAPAAAHVGSSFPAARALRAAVLAVAVLAGAIAGRSAVDAVLLRFAATPADRAMARYLKQLRRIDSFESRWDAASGREAKQHLLMTLAQRGRARLDDDALVDLFDAMRGIVAKGDVKACALVVRGPVGMTRDEAMRAMNAGLAAIDSATLAHFSYATYAAIKAEVTDQPPATTLTPQRFVQGARALRDAVPPAERPAFDRDGARMHELSPAEACAFGKTVLAALDRLSSSDQALVRLTLVQPPEAVAHFARELARQHTPTLAEAAEARMREGIARSADAALGRVPR